MNKVWVSDVLSNGELGENLGIREKFYGYDWEEPTHVVPRKSKEFMATMNRAGKGETLKRNEFPEASYVFSEKHFEKNAKDFFWVGGFIAVKGKLARILENFDLGEGGGLIPYPIYQKDKVTPYKGEFFLLNFGKGCQKDTFLSEESNLNAFRSRRTEEQHGYELWATFSQNGDDFALSSKAFGGPDLWFEVKVENKLFVCEQLARELNEARLNFDMRLSKCRVIGGGILYRDSLLFP